MESRHKETLKKIRNNLSEEQRSNELMLKKLYQSVLRGNRVQAGIISKATLILFPKADVMVADVMYRGLWKLGKHRQAIKIYIKAGRPFWNSEDIGRHYKRQGLVKKAMAEYEHLMDEYSKIRKDFMPFPNGPPELFKLGQWFASRDKVKARKYLELYLSAEDKCGNDPAFYLRYKNAARKILNKIS